MYPAAETGFKKMKEARKVLEWIRNPQPVSLLAIPSVNRQPSVVPLTMLLGAALGLLLFGRASPETG